MNYDIYSDFEATQDLSIFEFVSEGKCGAIPKRIKFVPTALSGVYNLAFGDINEVDEIDDLSISNNGDRNKVLATVARVVEIYTNKYPERMIYFRGSTTERTRLYRMAVGLNLEELSRKFEIFAEMEDCDEVLPFHKNMIISAFLIKRKFL
jgi:hypothetical protein